MSSKSITANPSIMKVVDQSIIFQHNPSLDQVERNISWVKEVPKIQLFSNGTIATLDGTMVTLVRIQALWFTAVVLINDKIILLLMFRIDF